MTQKILDFNEIIKDQVKKFLDKNKEEITNMIVCSTIDSLTVQKEIIRDINMNLELDIKFYKGASGKQNMWVEKNHDAGIRYEIDSIEDACEIFEELMKNVCD